MKESILDIKSEFLKELKQLMNKHKVSIHVTGGHYDDPKQEWLTYNNETDYSDTIGEIFEKL